MKTFYEIKRNLVQDVSMLPTIDLELIADSSTQLLSIALRGMAVEYGMAFDLVEADYDQVDAIIRAAESRIYKNDNGYVVLCQSTEKLLELFDALDVTDRLKLAEKRIELVSHLCSHSKKRIVCFNYPEIDDSVFGSYSSKVPQSFLYQLRRLNFKLIELSQQHSNLFVCDISSVQNWMGRTTFFDPVLYSSASMSYSLEALPWVASKVVDIICSAEGKQRKCLIVDLDNTLWGGNVGDVGWQGIEIGSDTKMGAVYSRIQSWIKKLRNRGIIVAVCSKNDERKAKEPFLKNRLMTLTLDDIALFIANWESKVDNIAYIKNTLQLPYSSMVFIDDNSFEREIVKKNLPEICVPDLPEDAGSYLEYLNSLNLFETASFLKSDKDRVRHYKEEVERSKFFEGFFNLDDYLESLQMKCRISGVDDFTRPRVSQLSLRSNQFNLRTVRYSEKQLDEISNNPLYKSFVFSLSDKFGDSGIISVVVLKEIETYTIFIENWLMSCRVLKRGVEDFVMNHLVEWCRCNNYRYVVGEYLPTSKNSMVEKHYLCMGFEQMGNNGQYMLNVENYEERKSRIKYER